MDSDKESVIEETVNEIKRAMPLNSAAKHLLIQLVAEHKSVLECKKTDFGTTTKKKQAWEAIATKFNSGLQDHPKTPAQLPKCWDNLKTKAKKDVITHVICNFDLLANITFSLQ